VLKAPAGERGEKAQGGEMLTILDLVVVAHVGFGAHIPWWLWTWAVLNEIAANDLQLKLRKAAEKLGKGL